MKKGRLTCCVPFCQRTTGRTEFSEWICGDHWKLIDKESRRIYGRHAREWRRYKAEGAGAAADRLWQRLKRIAIEKAVGVS